MRLDKSLNNRSIFFALVVCLSCNSVKQPTEAIGNDCDTVLLPHDSIVRRQFDLLPDTTLNAANYWALASEISAKNIRQQEKLGYYNENPKDQFFLMSDKVVSLDSNNPDSIYAVHISPYNIIKLKENYLIFNYYGPSISVLYYKPTNDSIIIQYESKIHGFIGSKEVHTESISYFTFAISSFLMNIESQIVYVVAYSNDSDEYKSVCLFVNLLEFGISGDCDVLTSNQYSIDYTNGIVTEISSIGVEKVYDMNLN